MDITWVLSALVGLGLATTAYFARAWLQVRDENVTLQAALASEAERDRERELMKAEFEALSQKLLSERSKELSSQHSETLSQVLKPLTTELDAFKKRVNEVYERETRDRVSLRQEIVSLKALNEKMSTDALNLTRALKGENKTARIKQLVTGASWCLIRC
jgi:DNA recombination protein RmuC